MKETILKRDFSEEFVAKMKNAMLLSHFNVNEMVTDKEGEG